MIGSPQTRPLVPPIQRISQRAGRIPAAVTRRPPVRRGRRRTSNLPPGGVQRVAIPRKGQPGHARQAHERTRGFRRPVKWRIGSEGRISHLKHRYGWERSLMDGIDGARTWCGHGLLAQNLVKISGLVEAKQTG